MSIRKIEASDVWPTLLGEYGTILQSALHMLNMIPPEVLDRAITNINQELLVGPLTNPSAYTDGVKFKNADEYIDVLSRVLELRQVIEAILGGEEGERQTSA